MNFYQKSLLLNRVNAGKNKMRLGELTNKGKELMNVIVKNTNGPNGEPFWYCVDNGPIFITERKAKNYILKIFEAKAYKSEIYSF